LLARNALINPNKDNTNIHNPSPVKYQPNDLKKKQKTAILAKVGSSLGMVEEQMSSAFKSEIKRDVTEFMAKDILLNPGPGAYDTQIQDKLKTLNF
jgi:hypothetical protein